MKKHNTKLCRHDEYVFDYSRNEHVCEQCRLRWKDTSLPMESSGYTFDRLLGRAW